MWIELGFTELHKCNKVRKSISYNLRYFFTVRLGRLTHWVSLLCKTEASIASV